MNATELAEISRGEHHIQNRRLRFRELNFLGSIGVLLVYSFVVASNGNQNFLPNQILSKELELLQNIGMNITMQNLVDVGKAIIPFGTLRAVQSGIGIARENNRLQSLQRRINLATEGD